MIANKSIIKVREMSIKYEEIKQQLENDKTLKKSELNQNKRPMQSGLESLLG
jgi:hypothetical protein